MKRSCSMSFCYFFHKKSPHTSLYMLFGRSDVRKRFCCQVRAGTAIKLFRCITRTTTNETGARRIVAIARGLLKLVLPFSKGMCQRTLRFVKIFNAVSCFPLGVIVPIEIVRAARRMCLWKTREGGKGCYSFLRARLGTEWVDKCVCTARLYKVVL